MQFLSDFPMVCEPAIVVRIADGDVKPLVFDVCGT